MSYPSNQINEGTSYVRFQSVKKIVGGVAIATLELETTLNGAISDTVNTLTLTSSAAFPNAGFIVIEKVNQDATSAAFGQYINETIEYTGNNTGTGVLSGLTRGTAAPFRGITFSNTTATTHANGAAVPLVNPNKTPVPVLLPVYSIVSFMYCPKAALVAS